MIQFKILATLIVCAMPLSGRAEDLPSRQDPRVIPVFHSDRIWNCVATTGDGRTFVSYPSVDEPGPQVEELTSASTAVPWPSQGWNSWKPGEGVLKTAFYHVNALRIGPEGKLWIVDSGSPGPGQPCLPGAARLFSFDTTTGSLDRVYTLDSGTKPLTYIDDVRFNGDHAYLTDAGTPGILVLELKTGKVRRVLDHDPSTTDLRPMKADGRIMRTKQGDELRVHADQLEVSPEGRYFYFQPASGPLARIETRWLDEPSLNPTALAAHVEASWVNTPTSGGTAIDANGNIYMGDSNRRRILKIAPDKTVTTLAVDSRFIWTDAMWIDRGGFLWIPATQLNRTAGLNGGKAAVDYPVWIYKMSIGSGPPPIDHP